jgi:hypothetical protein
VIRWLLLLLLPTAAAAQERTMAHVEGCLVWSYGPQGNISAYNECSRPLTLLFMDFDDQAVIRNELAAGGRFTGQRTRGFMFTACPVGSEPSLRFALENKEPIAVSLYNCVIGRPIS